MVRVNVIQVKQADVCLNNASVGYVKNSNVTKGEAQAKASQGYGTIMGAGKTNGGNHVLGNGIGDVGKAKNGNGGNCNGQSLAAVSAAGNGRLNGMSGVSHSISAIGNGGEQASVSGNGPVARSAVSNCMGNTMGNVMSTGLGSINDGALRNTVSNGMGNASGNGLPTRRHSRRLASTRGLARRPAPQPPNPGTPTAGVAPSPNAIRVLPPVADSPIRRKSPAPQPPWQASKSASPTTSPSPATSPLSPSPSPSSAPSSLSAAGTCPSLGGGAGGSGGPQLCGWVRVFTGTEAEAAAAAEAGGERGTLVYLTAASTVRDVCRDLLLADDLTVWVQYGGGCARRLRSDEAPLRVQDAFLRALGVRSASRRARLGVDPELRHLLRFRAGPGPAAPPLGAGPFGDPAAGPLAAWGGWCRAAHLQLLKGLVFPQWRRRPVALLGTKLYLYPGSPGAGGPEELELSGGGVSERAPRHGRLVLRITPGAPTPASGAGSGSAASSGGQRHVFLGFQQPWERDLWRGWLDEAVQLPSCPERLDLSDGGLQRLPDSLPSFSSLRELILARNRLGGTPLDGSSFTCHSSAYAQDDGDGCCDMSALTRLPLLRALSLASNGLRAPPTALLRLAGLHSLDLSDNAIQQLPADIDHLANLVELRVERNLLRELPSALSRLRKLRSLHAAHNRLSAPPQRLHDMRALTLLDLQGNRIETGRLPAEGDATASSLSRVNLRGNLLKGCIVLGNYGGAWREELCAPAAPPQPPPRRSSATSGRRAPAPGPPIRDRKHRLFGRSRSTPASARATPVPPVAGPTPSPTLTPFPSPAPAVAPRHRSLKETAAAGKAKNKYLDYFRRASTNSAPAPYAGSLGNFHYQAVVAKHKEALPRIIRGPQANLQLRLKVSDELQHLRLDGTPFQNLTQLDVSENCIESLDLSALTKLESVQCSRNRLTELSLHGKAIVSLIAGNNRLQKLTITPAPTNLKHLDVSYNELEALPAWLSACSQLRVLFASHNLLRSLPEHLLRGDAAPALHTLQLSYNQLSALPAPTPAPHGPRGQPAPLPLQELFLQSNSIAMLPHGFLRAAARLRVLNLSNNRLCELPPGPEPSESADHQLEKLYLTANCLTDSALHVIATFANLRTLHAAYNCITALPESCVAMWKDLEELVLSGNKLQYLPDNLTRLEHLRVLRVHSNRLQASPCFAKMTSLKVLDLAHNQLDRINLATLVPQQLQFLDLSCNSRLYVDPRQFQVYRTHRPMNMVDVSGQNRTCLPSTPYHDEGGEMEPPWKVGFSETAGLRERLYITQIRLPSFCNTEGLFGLFDGGNNNDIPNILIKAVPRILLEERTVKETADDYMKYTMLSAHRELKEKGQKYGVCATLCHLARPRPTSGSNGCPGSDGFFPGAGGGRYVLRVASVGEAGAVLCRRSEGVRLCPPDDRSAAPTQIKNQLGCSAMFPLVIPDPRVTEIQLEEEDEFLIIANKSFWDVVSMEEAVEEARHMGNAILAAKKLQDLAQSYGSEENLSIMVIRFSHTGSDMDQLMRELRHTIRRGKQQQNQLAMDNSSPESNGRPKCYCQGIANGGDIFYNGLPSVPPHFKPGVGRTLQEQRPPASRNGTIPDADRSSPSGQSDQASSDYTSKKCSVSSRRPSVQHPPLWGETNGTKTTMFVKTGNSISPARQPQHQSVLMHENGTKKMTAGVQGLERRSYRESKRSGGGVLKAIRAKLDTYSNGHLADTEGEETGSDRSAGTQPSEEQFKCWEYMLEQNTQMLFDKELDTLSRSGFVRPTREPLPDPLWPRGGKILSRSSPHLAENSAPVTAPFLSRHFGSARSFNPVSRSTRFGSGRFLNGGPNAAYFGSLQRLMPYNLEYNFAVIQERAANQDSLEQDGRMQQYWGVATTEL